MVKNPSANAGDPGSIPGLGRSHMPGSNEAHEPQLLKPARLEPMLCNKEPPQREAYTPQLESGPHLLQLKQKQWRPREAKNK